MMDGAFLNAYARIKRGCDYTQAHGVGLFRLPAFSAAGMVNHGFSARVGGVSEGGFASLNLSFTRDKDARAHVMENYRRFAHAADIPWESMVMDAFEHGAVVREVDAAHAGAGYLCAPLPACDGLITADASVTLVTGHADCLPLFLLDTKNRCIGLAHAGYKGTYAKIAQNTVRAMRDAYGSRPQDMLAGIGPCICGRCYEVDMALKNSFEEAFPGIPFFTERENGKAMIDLAAITAAQWLDMGIAPQNISLMDVCTYEDAERLYSYRRDGADTGGMAAYMQLMPAGA